MPVLVDGNNLLFAARAIDDERRLVGRSMLCTLLARWAERTGETVHIVFDGAAPSGPLAAQIAGDGVRVTYSGAGVSADDVLGRMIDADSAARRLTVVSTDRAVGKAARRRRARSIDARDFWIRVRRDLSRPVPTSLEPDEKEAGLLPDASEEWLRELGLEDGGLRS